MTTVACSSLAFNDQSLEQALSNIAGLGYTTVELGVIEGWAHVSGSAIAEDARPLARNAAAAAGRHGLTITMLNAVIDDTDPDVARYRMMGIAEFADELNVQIVTLSPETGDRSFDDLVRFWRGLVPLTLPYSFIIGFETHRDEVTEMPDKAVEFVKSVGDCFITLDPSHFYAGPNRGLEFDQVFPLTRHLHVRDARATPPELEVDFGTGDIDFEEIMRKLNNSNWSGLVSAEYIDRHDTLEQSRKVLSFFDDRVGTDHSTGRSRTQ